MSFLGKDVNASDLCDAIACGTDGIVSDCDRKNTPHIVHSNPRERWAKIPGGIVAFARRRSKG